jgi:hypothetical protein
MKNNSDYQKSFTVNKTAQEVYEAITEQVQDWWSDDFTGSAAKKGDQYKIAFGETRKTFEIAEAIPDKQVVWLCRVAYIDMDTLTKKDEWVGTKIFFTLSADEKGTTLTFLHEGLNPGMQCYSVCEPGWDYFIDSLHKFITTGTGAPYKKAVAKLELEG